MKDYIITITAIFIMVLGILLCHKYTLNMNYSEITESIPDKPVINTVLYDDNAGYNNNAVTYPVVTTVSSQNNNFMVFQNTDSETNLTTDISEYIEAESEITTTTVYRSILENATAVNTTVYQFSIIQNPQIPQTETTPIIPDDFQLTIN